MNRRPVAFLAAMHRQTQSLFPRPEFLTFMVLVKRPRRYIMLRPLPSLVPLASRQTSRLFKLGQSSRRAPQLQVKLPHTHTHTPTFVCVCLCVLRLRRKQSHTRNKAEWLKYFQSHSLAGEKHSSPQPGNNYTDEQSKLYLGDPLRDKKIYCKIFFNFSFDSLWFATSFSSAQRKCSS